MYIYHALFNALSVHMIHINLNMVFYTHVEQRPTKTIYIKYYKKCFLKSYKTLKEQLNGEKWDLDTYLLLVELCWFRVQFSQKQISILHLIFRRLSVIGCCFVAWKRPGITPQISMFWFVPNKQRSLPFLNPFLMTSFIQVYRRMETAGFPRGLADSNRERKWKWKN